MNWEQVDQYVDQYDLLPVNTPVVIGLSGGADSVCLLLYLKAIQKKRNLNLLAVHLHHGIRGKEADQDAAFAEKLCKKLEIPFHLYQKDVPAYAQETKKSLEEAGRELRYRIFAEEAKKLGENARIAVAHHKNDQAETILHNLFRGTGIRGLGGMQPLQGKIIRPFLALTREEIEEILKEEGQDCCQDSTNGDTGYTRNKIRQTLIPMIQEEINTKAVEHIAEVGMRLQKAEAYFEAECLRRFEKMGIIGKEQNRVGILISDLNQQEELFQEYLIRYMMELVCGRKKDLTANHVEIVRKLAGNTTGKKVNLPYGMTANISYDTLWIKIEDPIEIETEYVSLEGMEIGDVRQVGEVTIHLQLAENEMEIPQNQYTKWMDYDKIGSALCVRSRQTGDYFLLKDGKRKTLKSYLIDEKIPREERDRLKLLADGSHVLWIIGKRISEGVKITEHTKRMAIVTYNRND